MRAGEKPKYSNQFETISDSISTPYECDVFHYIVPASGEYLVYTTGSLDTVGRLYKYTWLNSWPAQTGVIDDNYGNALGRTSASNFFTRITLSKGENLYVVIRGYGNSTGDYQLHIEPYRDKCVYDYGGMWENKKLVGITPIIAAPRKTESTVFRQWYYTAEQTAELYRILTNRAIRALIQNYWDEISPQGLFRRAVQDHLMTISTLDSIGFLSIIPGSSQANWVISSTVEYWCDAVYHNTTEVAEFLANIETYCGLLPYTTPVTAPTGQSANAEYYTCTSGLTYQTKATREYIPVSSFYAYYRPIEYKTVNFQTFNSDEMYGAPFIHGKWHLNANDDLPQDEFLPLN